jgi:hypothetical protein
MLLANPFIPDPPADCAGLDPLHVASVRGIATMRYQFPYMEHGSKRPDTPKLAQATVRAAVLKAAQLVPDLVTLSPAEPYGLAH